MARYGSEYDNPIISLCIAFPLELHHHKKWRPVSKMAPSAVGAARPFFIMLMAPYLMSCTIPSSILCRAEIS